MAEPDDYDDGMVKWARVPTPAAREVILQRSGPIYEAAIAWLLKYDTNASREDATRALHELCGPWTIEDLFRQPQSVKYIPDYVYASPGQRFELLETDPNVVTACTIRMNAERLAMRKHFGGPEGIRQLRDLHVQEGGSPEAFDARFDSVIAETRQRWQQIASTAKAATTTGTRQQRTPSDRGCASAIVLVVGGSLAAYALSTLL